MSIIHNSDDYFPYHRHHSSSPQLQQPQQQHHILTPEPTTMTTQPFYEMYERIDHDIQVTTTSMTNNNNNNTHQPHSQHSHHYYNNNTNNNNSNNYSPPPPLHQHHHHHHSLSQQQQQQQIYSSSPPLSSSSLRYVFVDTQKEREALEQENVRLMQHKNQIECHICELDDLIQLIQSKKMELQMEVEQMDRKQSQTVQELERVRMKIETNRKRKNHHSQQQSTNDVYHNSNNNHESFHPGETMFSLHHNDRSRSNSNSSSSSSSGGGGGDDRSSVASDDTLLSENTNNTRRRPSLPSFYSSHPQFTNNMLSKRHHHHHHTSNNNNNNNNMNTNSNNNNNKGMMMDRFAALLYGNGMTNAMAAAAASAGLIDTCDLTLDHHSNELKTLARQKQLQHSREASTTLKQNALQIEISTAGTLSSPNRRELEASSSSVTNSAVITSTNKNGILTKKRYDLLSVTLLPSSKVISGSSDGYIHIWDISSDKVNKPELKVRAHNGWVRCVASDPDGHYVVTGGGDKNIHLYALESDHLDGSWNDDDGDEIGDVSYVAPVREGLKQKGILEGHNGGVTCVQADLSAVISGSVDREIKLWDIGTGKCVSTMVGHKSYVKTLQFYTYALASGGGCESEIKLWDIRSGRCVRRFFGHHRGVSALHFDEQRLVSGGRCDGMIKIFDLRMGALLDSLPLGPYQDQEPDYDMSRRNSLSSLSSRSSDLSGFSGLSGINSQRPRSTSYDIKEPMLNTNQTVTCLRFHHDKLIFGAKGLLGPVMYDMKTKSPVKQFLGHASHVNDLDFNRSCLVTASRDLTVKVWREEL